MFSQEGYVMVEVALCQRSGAGTKERNLQAVMPFPRAAMRVSEK
jgi:hypothetical protein